MKRSIIIVMALAGAFAGLAAGAAAPEFGPWSAAVNVQSIPGTDPALNTEFLDGCPTLARDGRTLFMASNRTNGKGLLDIWVASRESADAPWGEPVNVGWPVNTEADEFCPSPARDGHLFFFVSTRPGGCGGSDIWVTRRRSDQLGWDEPINLGCHLNSAGNEASPFLIEERGAGPVLYFSSNRAGGYAPDAPGAIIGDDDIYVSESHGGILGPRELVRGVNSASNDSRPNLRRDGLELFFDSTRGGPGTQGGADIFSSTRTGVFDPWSNPAPLGPLVNSALADTRASLSWDGTTLVFGSNRAGGEGSTDVYVATRVPVNGGP